MEYSTYIFIIIIAVLYIDYCVDRIRADRQAANMTAVIDQQLLTEAPEGKMLQPSPSPILNMPEDSFFHLEPTQTSVSTPTTEPVLIEVDEQPMAADRFTSGSATLASPSSDEPTHEPTSPVHHPQLLMSISDGLLTVKQMKTIARSFGVRHKNLRKLDLQQQLLAAFGV